MRFQYLGLSEKYKGSAPYLRVTIWLFVSDVFRGGSEVVSKISDHFRSSWLVRPVQFSWGVSALVAGLFCSSALIWRQPGGFLVPWFPALQGFQSSRRDCFVDAIDFLWSILPAFCFVVPWCRRSRKVCLPFSPDGLFLYLSFLLFCDKGKIKYKLSMNVVSPVLRGFYYWITLSHSDFANCRMH